MDAQLPIGSSFKGIVGSLVFPESVDWFRASLLVRFQKSRTVVVTQMVLEELDVDGQWIELGLGGNTQEQLSPGGPWAGGMSVAIADTDTWVRGRWSAQPGVDSALVFTEVVLLVERGADPTW